MPGNVGLFHLSYVLQHCIVIVDFFFSISLCEFFESNVTMFASALALDIGLSVK